MHMCTQAFVSRSLHMSHRVFCHSDTGHRTEYHLGLSTRPSHAFCLRKIRPHTGPRRPVSAYPCRGIVRPCTACIAQVRLTVANPVARASSKAADTRPDRQVESSPAPGSGMTFAATQTPHVRACGCPSTPRRMCPRWATCKTPATPNCTFRASRLTPHPHDSKARQLAERECVPAPSCASTKDTRNSAATDLTASLAVSHRAVILGLVSL